MTRLIGLILIAAASFAAPARADDTPAATACHFRAFAIDRDPSGTNIRAAPRGDAAALARMPAPVHLSPDDLVGTEFDVIATKDGWLQIRNADWGDPTGASANNHWDFAGPGWVAGSLVGVQVADARLRTAPRDDAPIQVWLRDTERGWGPDSFVVKRVHDCRGDFVEITVAPPRGTKTRRGWVSHVCASQLTTCDYSYPEGVTLPEHYHYPD